MGSASVGSAGAAVNQRFPVELQVQLGAVQKQLEDLHAQQPGKAGVCVCVCVSASAHVHSVRVM